MQGDEADSMFEQLYGVFRRTILPTYQCRNVQFVLFHACSFDVQFASQFVREMVVTVRTAAT